MKYAIILVIFFSLKAQAQSGETKWVPSPKYKFDVPSDVYQEGTDQNLVSDRISISFTRDEECNIKNYVVKQGKLKSFAEWAKKDSANIIKELEKYAPCKSGEKKEFKNVPIQINFSTN